MGARQRRLTAPCRCGRAAVEIVGKPILSAVCCCESCRTAGRQFERGPGAGPVMRTDGGTDYCLYRKDRARIVLGRDHLAEHRLTAASPTRRVLATCCHTPMFLDFTDGHWLTLYRDRLSSDAPQLQMRVMARDSPTGAVFGDAIPTYRTHPARFVFALLAAWIAMGFQRPKIAL
jgi:hypothetical protein